MVEWSRRVLDWTLQNIPEFGFLFDGLGLDGFFSTTCETCGLADLVHLALLLTEAGVGDYWDPIERIVRNQLLENQLKDAAQLRTLFPGIDEPVLAMMYGGFECAAYPQPAPQLYRCRRLLYRRGAAGALPCVAGGRHGDGWPILCQHGLLSLDALPGDRSRALGAVASTSACALHAVSTCGCPVG